jgi:adenylate kinase
VYTREDDKAEAVQKRLVVYREQTAPLIGWYRERGLLVDIDANGDVEKILIHFKKALNF